MPHFARRRRGRKAHRRARKNHRRGRRSPAVATAGRGQMARIVETLELNDLTPNVTYDSTFTLAQFPRAATVAMNFQFYKAAKVTWNYEPLYNTFQENQIGGVSSVSKPYIYMLMNRIQNSNMGTTLPNIQACGAKPQAMTAKKTLTYKPNWCSPGLLAVQPGTSPVEPINSHVQQGLKAQYGWLASSGTANLINGPNGAGVGEATISGNQATAYAPIGAEYTGAFTQNTKVYANSVTYNGHVSYIEQQNAVLGQTVARLTCTVEWLFKGAQLNQKITPYVPPSAETKP